MRRPATARFAMGLVGLLAGCTGGREVRLPEAGAITPPTFHTVPAKLERSPQLQALVPRDTAGIRVDGDPFTLDLLPDGLAALATLDTFPGTLTSLTIYSGYIGFSFDENGIPGRSISVSYDPSRELYVSDPRFDESPSYDVDQVDPEVIARVVEAIEARVPYAQVTGMYLDAERSYDLGLVWTIEVTDAIGTLANVFVQPDGAIVAVDPS